MSRQTAKLEARLEVLALLVVGADIALWLVMGQAGALAWSLYGAVAASLAAALGVVLALRSRAYRARVAKVSRTRHDVWLSKIRWNERQASYGLDTARPFQQRLKEEIRRSAAYGCAMGLIVVRVGGGGTLDAGLEGLVADRIASALRRQLRGSDVAG